MWSQQLHYDSIFFVFCLFRAKPMEHGHFQARGLTRGRAASLHQSHSNGGSEPPLQPTPQLMAMQNP